MQQALNEPGRLPECHAEQHLHRQASLDGGIAVGLLSATFATRCSIPDHLWVKPALRRLLAIAYQPTDRQRPTALERFIIGRPVRGLVSRVYVSAHASQLPCWIHEMNPSPHTICATEP